MHLLCLIDVLRKQAIHCHRMLYFWPLRIWHKLSETPVYTASPSPPNDQRPTVRGAVAMHCRTVCAIKALRLPGKHEIHLHCLLSSFQMMLYPSLKDITCSYIFLLSCCVSCIITEHEQTIKNFSDTLMKYPGQDTMSSSLWCMKPHSWPGKNILI